MNIKKTKVTEKEIFEVLKASDDHEMDVEALPMFKNNSAKFLWICCYLRRMFAEGQTEFRISMLNEKKGIIHPLGKDGETLDFTL